MTELEKVEKLREKADVSFSEAKEVLDAANGDILDALILLEKQGKSTIPSGGGFFSGSGAPAPQWQPAPGGGDGAAGYESGSTAGNSGESFSDMLKRFGRFCLMLLRKGNSNFLEATKEGELKFSCPVTMVILFLIFFFWVTVPLFVISLFFGFRYHFRGDDLGRDSVNNVMTGASNVVDEVKQSFADRKNYKDEQESDTPPDA